MSVKVRVGGGMFRLLKSWAFIHYVLLLGLLFFFVYLSASNNTVRVDLQHAVFDYFNRTHPREADQKVLIVDIDEKALARFGQWPWPRDIMAQLTERLKDLGAKVIAFDGVFGEIDRLSPKYIIRSLPSEQSSLIFKEFPEDQLLDNDDVFAQAIKKSDIFVTAFTYGRTDREQKSPLNKNRLLAKKHVKEVFLTYASYFDAVAINIPVLEQAAAGNGSFMARPDRDGVLRRAGLVFTDGKNIYPSLSLEALRVAKLGRKGTMRLVEIPFDEQQAVDTQYRIIIDDLVAPVDADGIIYVYYRYFCNEHELGVSYCSSRDYLSVADVMDPNNSYDELKTLVKDKIILIGASAEGLKDLRSTALQPFRPGVEVHANVIEQILSSKYLLRPAMIQNVEATYILFVGLFFILVSPFIGILVSMFLSSALVALSAFGAYYIYVEKGILIDPVYPAFCTMIIFVSSTILSYARAEHKRKQIRGAFGMYVAKDVMRELEKDPDKLRLGGEMRNLTVMFTDIRKFTTISEGLSPEELIELMNRFLTAMAEIVMKYHGTVDKFMGDAMMAFWNAPRDIEGHERLACLAALEMQTALEPINNEIMQKAAASGIQPVKLEAGIGLNTGDCAVGNMGSLQRFAYSALGDAVNFASRLEGQTKTYHVSILIGENTYEQVKDFAVLELDYIRVVGKNKPMRIFTLIGNDGVAKSEDFKNWKELHASFIEKYRAQSFEKAKKLIVNLKNSAFEDFKDIYSVYEERIDDYLLNPPPENWDGVYIATGK